MASIASSVPDLMDVDDIVGDTVGPPGIAAASQPPPGATVFGDNVDFNGSGAQPFAGVVPPAATFAGPSAEQFNAPASSPGAARGRASAARASSDRRPSKRRFGATTQASPPGDTDVPVQGSPAPSIPRRAPRSFRISSPAPEVPPMPASFGGQTLPTMSPDQMMNLIQLLLSNQSQASKRRDEDNGVLPEKFFRRLDNFKGDAASYRQWRFDFMIAIGEVDKRTPGELADGAIQDQLWR